jgi:hypothetical protein
MAKRPLERKSNKVKEIREKVKEVNTKKRLR